MHSGENRCVAFAMHLLMSEGCHSRVIQNVMALEGQGL